MLPEIVLLVLTFSSMRASGAQERPPLVKPMSFQADIDSKTVACYWETRYFYENNFNSDDIDISLCTHLIYGYGVALDEAGTQHGALDNTTWTLGHEDKLLDIDLGGFRNISAMKKKRPELKVEFAIGRWQTPEDFYIMAKDPEKRDTFIKSSIFFLSEHGFDGLHIHWGNPAATVASQFRCPDCTGTSETSKDPSHLTSLLKEAKQPFLQANLTVSLAMWSVLPSKLKKNFEITEVYKYADLVFINAMHYHGFWETRTGGFSPLYASANAKVSDNKYLTVDAAWSFLKKRGALACKTVLVIGLKGSGFKLKNVFVNGIEADTVEADSATLAAGDEPSFRQICKLQSTTNWTKKWDQETKVTYIYRNDQWISYEDKKSVEEKVKYANMEGMRGVAVTSLRQDDVYGECFNTTYPLLRTAFTTQSTGLCGSAQTFGHSFLVMTICFVLPLITAK